MLNGFTESVVEEGALEWFGEVRYSMAACVDLNHRNIRRQWWY